MRIRKTANGRRRGAATVETALVMIPLTMLLFGVFEYGRLLMVWNLVNNSSREGCRYALANNTAFNSSSSPTPLVAFTNAVTAVVTARMGGQDTKALTGFTVSVSGTHNGSSVSDVTTLLPGDMVTVTVTGTYNFMHVIPLVRMTAPLSISSSVTMVCEGGS
jgi:Flp pilus assembly protein TadG